MLISQVLKSHIHLQAAKGIQFRGSETGDTLNLNLLIQMHVVQSRRLGGEDGFPTAHGSHSPGS